MDIPSPGLGTSGNDDPEQCAETVSTALDLGYRHVDTAQAYDNEAAVGEGIERAGVPREDVVVATKVHPDDLQPDDVRRTARESLDRLGGDVIDLVYVHWPVRAYDAGATLPAFDALIEDGFVRRVGLSNFTPELLEEARSVLHHDVAAHQVECHPFLQQRELRADAREHGHPLVAYAPLAQGAVFDDPHLQAIAAEYGATVARVVMGWFAAKPELVPIPKATGAEHLRENVDPVELRDEDVARIDDLDRTERVIDPDYGPWNRDRNGNANA